MCACVTEEKTRLQRKYRILMGDLEAARIHTQEYIHKQWSVRQIHIHVFLILHIYRDLHIYSASLLLGSGLIQCSGYCIYAVSFTATLTKKKCWRFIETSHLILTRRIC